MRVRFLVPAAAILVTLATTTLTERSLAASASTSSVSDMADRFNNDPRGKGTKIGSDVANALLKAQKEDADHQLDAALADARKAGAAAQSDYEKLKVNQTLTQIYVDMQDIPNAATAAETAADLKGTPAAELPDVLINACLLATAVYDYDKAAIYAHQMQSLKLSDDRSKRIIETALHNEPKPTGQTAAH